jgi:transcriptional regulator
MHVPKYNEETDIPTLHSLIKSKPLGAWTAITDGEIVINHIPFVLNPNRGELGTLVGHVARSNPIWQEYSTDKNSVVLFQGDQAYITPSWYPSKHKHGKAVPTWNYVVVHAHGIPKKTEDPEWLLQHLTELSNLHEAERRFPWKISDAPEEYIEKMIRAIVGIEIPIAKLTGKWKLGQNRPETDKLGIIAGLTSTEEPQALGLADLLNQHMKSNT